ncbi:RAX1 [Candida oxycetoniae]|uniref:RAX1 n=1 Tax=Candida oxycetoniae TaxID=497107 RepID=A0AAI9WZR3_9ASCO|nr:RAX1 [Candida oxycetoniae]KAI3406160.2 RAX1 [Candida oxycetoniae]
MVDIKNESNFPNSHYLSSLNNPNGPNQTIHLNRLPTLGEILANKSKTPVDLFTFYQFMKDVEGKVDYLDFWFDLINHLNLCKHYIKGLRDSIVRQSGTFNGQQQQRPPNVVQGSNATQRSNTSSPNPQLQLNQNQNQNYSPISPSFPSNSPSLSGLRNSDSNLDSQQKHKSLSSSILLDLIINDNILEENDSHRLSAFLRGDINLDNLDPKLKELIVQYNEETGENTHSQMSLNKGNVSARSSPGFIPSPGVPGLSSYQPPQYPPGKRASSTFNLFNDEDEDDDEDDNNTDNHEHSRDSLYENQLDIGQANRAVHFTKYVSLHSGNNTPQENDAVANLSTSNLVLSVPPQKRVSSAINPSLLERLIKDSPAASSNNNSFITRENLRESSHNLLLKYFVEDSEKNLNLPQQLNAYIIKSIEVDGRDDPDVFNYVKNFIYNRLENDHLPKFLDFMATRNINHSNFLRIVLGFFFIFGSFWMSFIFVFLNYRKGLRPVIVAPYFIGFYFIVSSIYLVDPFLAWTGLSETFSKSNGRSILKIEEKFVHQFIVKRSFWVMFLILVFTAVFTVLFSLVPGHRL